jgi:hypothetical protein
MIEPILTEQQAASGKEQSDQSLVEMKLGA